MNKTEFLPTGASVLLRGRLSLKTEGRVIEQKAAVCQNGPTSLSPLLPGNLGNSSLSLSEMLCSIPQTRFEGML